MPRGHFPIGFDEASGFNCLQHGAADTGWQGDAELSCAREPVPMSPGIRVPISLPAPLLRLLRPLLLKLSCGVRLNKR